MSDEDGWLSKIGRLITGRGLSADDTRALDHALPGPGTTDGYATAHPDRVPRQPELVEPSTLEVNRSGVGPQGDPSNFVEANAAPVANDGQTPFKVGKGYSQVYRNEPGPPRVASQGQDGRGAYFKPDRPQSEEERQAAHLARLELIRQAMANAGKK